MTIGSLANKAGCNCKWSLYTKWSELHIQQGVASRGYSGNRSRVHEGEAISSQVKRKLIASPSDSKQFCLTSGSGLSPVRPSDTFCDWFCKGRRQLAVLWLESTCMFTAAITVASIGFCYCQYFAMLCQDASSNLDQAVHRPPRRPTKTSQTVAGLVQG